MFRIWGEVGIGRSFAEIQYGEQAWDVKMALGNMGRWDRDSDSAGHWTVQ